MLRDGESIYFEPYNIRSPRVAFAWHEKDRLPGEHVYQLHIPSKFLSSPVVFAR